ncbi:NUDIX domain-containing protein [Microbacterium sp. MPKO10]|uniref:NUDIX domain-containing protein n=1 Tax=Microbacterium sp. MPKO10 TaxID=2989818 RepID=UPI00355651FC
MTDIYADDRSGESSDRLRSLGAIEIPNPDRVTSVAVVPVDTRSGRVLGVMLRERGLDIPGGHRQYEDIDMEATARRETLEEASADFETVPRATWKRSAARACAHPSRTTSWTSFNRPCGFNAARAWVT